jgi:hypothetical protein
MTPVITLEPATDLITQLSLGNHTVILLTSPTISNTNFVDVRTSEVGTN